MIEYPEKHAPTFRQVTWAEIEQEVQQVNPEFHSIVCELDPGPEYRLYLGEYPYGCQILERGKFRVPVGGGLAPLPSQAIPDQIREDLSYNIASNPAGIILDKSFEIFLDKPITDTPVVFAIIRQGEFIGLSRLLSNAQHQPAFVWNITSGVRSAFMLPKISQTRKYKKLRNELNINTEIPKGIEEHWDTFTSISNSECSKTWRSKILFFSNPWFEILEDKKWEHLKSFLLNNAIPSIVNFGSSYIWDSVLSLILKERQIRPSLYTNNIVKYLFQIAAGMMPGFQPTLDESGIPLYEIQKVFTEIYEIDNYIPTIITPGYFQKENNVYCSLCIPNILDTPKKKNNTSNISETYDIKSLLDKYTSEIKNEKFNLSKTELYNFLLEHKIIAFHNNPEKYSNIFPVESLIQSDQRFLQSTYPSKNHEPAIFSSFFKGCFMLT